MSRVFFDQLKIPRPRHHLRVGSASHGRQTAAMLSGIEEVLSDERPDMVLVYGDTNSTLAAALAAVKMNIPVAHVEAGLRSFNRRMPEEVNRVVTDHISSLLFCPTREALENLGAEGITEGVHLVGDVMFDCALHFAETAESLCDPLADYSLARRRYILMTCHRAENTDNPQRLEAIMRAASRIGDTMPVLFPVHPRTANQLATGKFPISDNVRMVSPTAYLEMLLLERNAAVILTDSGGVQKEAFIFGVPCVTMREETEWCQTLKDGGNLLAGADEETIVQAVWRQVNRVGPRANPADHYGDGKAAQRVINLMVEAGRKHTEMLVA